MTSPVTAASKVNKKLPARYGASLTPLVISVLMSCIVSGVSTVKSLGPGSESEMEVALTED